ncbi:MAG: dihydroorotase [Proteobacteria bacterium]|nr:dihydroorotase [Pseudomonadota bacterium]
MAERFDLIVRGGTCVTPSGTVKTDVGARNGRFEALGDLSRAEAAVTLEAKGLHVLPGVIDSQVHFREPGSEDCDTIATGSTGAVLGGVACVFDMPNTNPAITSSERLAWKREFVKGRIRCDMGLYVGASKENIAELAALEREPNVCGIKVFAGASTGNLLIEDDEHLEKVMRNGFRRIAYHSEDEYRMRERRALIKDGDPYIKHMEWRDVECAVRCTKRLIALARKTGRRAHILHVSTAEEMELLKDYRDLATVEVLPNHLTAWAPDVYDRLGGFAVMNPPIRTKEHYEALWKAVREGLVDVIGSDHAPHTKKNKQNPYPHTGSGMTGVQTTVPIMLDHVNAGRLSIERFVDLMCTGPARAFGLVGKGRIARGYDADLTVVDLKKKRTISNDWIVAVCGWTCFDGVGVTGWPVATVVRGNIVMREDELIGEPIGRLARFGDALAPAAR